MIVFLNSSLDTNYKDEMGNRIPQHFGNKNGILDNLKKYIKKYDNFLFIASDENAYDITDLYAQVAIDSFKITLPFKKYTVLDGRNYIEAPSLIKNADFIFLSGGHVPTQLKFFEKIKLKELLKDTNAIIAGSSAGSMNCARIVYCPPEYETEFLDNTFNRFLRGLSLTNINIFPHYNELKDQYIAGFNHIEDICKPDSYKCDIYALVDGSYILIEEGLSTIYGEAYLIRNGEISNICRDDESIKLDC